MYTNTYLLPMLGIVIIALLAMALYAGAQSHQDSRRLEGSDARARDIRVGTLKKGDVFWFESPTASHWYVTQPPVVDGDVVRIRATVGGSLTPRILERPIDTTVHALPR